MLKGVKSIYNYVSPRQRLLKKIKIWWDNSDQDNDALKTLLDNNTTIDGYTFVATSGHTASIIAKKGWQSIIIMDCRAPEKPDEFREKFVKKLNELTGGKKRKTRRNKKSKKSRKSKSRKSKSRKSKSRNNYKK